MVGRIFIGEMQVYVVSNHYGGSTTCKKCGKPSDNRLKNVTNVVQQVRVS